MTDEQRMREAFREWADSGMRYVTDRRSDGAYISPDADDAWEGFRAGQLARDAEVQALRDTLLRVYDRISTGLDLQDGSIPNAQLTAAINDVARMVAAAFDSPESGAE